VVLLALTILVLAGAVPVPAFAPQDPTFVVIVNTANPVDSISADQLSKIFLKKIRQWEGNRAIHVVEQRTSARIRSVFAEQIHRRSVSAVSAYWQQQIFSGRAVPPPERSADSEIVDYVAGSIDAIGYVAPGTALGPNIKAIRVVR
jgi:ABC-type phosphate transport system substrate-binding protein